MWSIVPVARLQSGQDIETTSFQANSQSDEGKWPSLSRDSITWSFLDSYPYGAFACLLFMQYNFRHVCPLSHSSVHCI